MNYDNTRPFAVYARVAIRNAIYSYWRKLQKEHIVVDFEVGDTVSVVSGAWADTVGVIQAINTPKQSVTINVELFGRETPVEIGFSDVKKM